jgi:methionine sulfoxide reductase heme-binding subunit
LRLSDRAVRWGLKPIVFLACLAPFCWIAWAAFTGNLSANPLQDITHDTGDWTIRFICLTLAITPLRRLTGWNGFIKFRRMIGLFAFFYGTSHFLIYVIADRFASLDFPNGIVAWTTVVNLGKSIWDDIAKRPYITVGFTALLTMVPLAITSTAGWIRRLGGKRWNRLHRLVYATGVLAVIHYWWLVKADIRRPAAYGAVVAVLLGLRVYWAQRRRAPAARPALS